MWTLVFAWCKINYKEVITCLEIKNLIQKRSKTLVALINNRKSIAEVSREYGVATSNLVDWKKLYTKLCPEADETMTLAEFKRMKKEYESIKEEQKGLNNIFEKLDDTKLYELIKSLKEVHSQEKMCVVFKVNRSSYYANLNRKPTKI